MSSLLTRAFKASSSMSAISAYRVARLYRFQSTATATAQILHEEPERPPRHFATLKGVISDKTLSAIIGQPLNLETMTPVQEEVLSLLPALSEPHDPKTPNVRDLLVRAKTGTGKTLTFLVPAIEARVKAIKAAGKKALIDAGLNNDPALERRAMEKYARETVGALIVSPTRELATQIANEAIRLMHHSGMEVRLFTGGVGKRDQMRGWMQGRRDIVVATTGRLRDLMDSEPEVLKSIATTSTLVLDEADTMLEMGFRDDIAAIEKKLIRSPARQTLLFSATVSPVIRQVAESTLARQYKYIDCVKSDDSPVHAHVPQYHTILPNASAQIPHILKLIAHDQLINPGTSKVILFLPTTKMTQLFSTILRELSRTILPYKTNIHEIHSKRTMESRTAASARFRADKSFASVLVTSDVSARGVDYPGVTRVIQVGIPGSTDQYVHRVGRTGRTGGIVGRGDLVLLPWEIGFITWQLTEVPIKPVTVAEMDIQLGNLSKVADAAPLGMRKPTMLEEFETAPLQLLPRFDPEAIRETFMSLLGYYFAKSPELRVQKTVILEGCKDWAMKACGLSTPPYVSEQFLQKLGMGDGRTGSSYGKPRIERSFEPRYDAKSPWMGRGTTKSKEARAAKEATTSEGYKSDGTGYRSSEQGGNRYGSGGGERTGYGFRGGERREGAGSGYGSDGAARRVGYGGGGGQKSGGFGGGYGSDGGARRGGYGGGERSKGYGGGERGTGYGGGERSTGFGGGGRSTSYGGGGRSTGYGGGERSTGAGSGYGSEGGAKRGGYGGGGGQRSGGYGGGYQKSNYGLS